MVNNFRYLSSKGRDRGPDTLRQVFIIMREGQGGLIPLDFHLEYYRGTPIFDVQQ